MKLLNLFYEFQKILILKIKPNHAILIFLNLFILEFIKRYLI